MTDQSPPEPPNALPTGRKPISTLLGRAIRRECPNCGHKDIWKSWWSIRDSCPNCKYVFAREGGYFLGAMALNLIVTEFATMIVLTILLIWTSWEWWEIELLVLPMAIVLPLTFYPFARGLWMALDLTITPVNQR